MKQIANRLTQLDILRGIAIFFVVFGHIIHIPELRNYMVHPTFRVIVVN